MPEKNLIEQKVIDTLEKNYMPYAMSMIVSRAIPEIDGFKPSHRKLLYTMFKMGLLKGNRTKSANVVGQTMKLNPHGDMAIYETLVRLTRGNDAILHSYIDSKGNFGKHYSRDMKFAAPRYTEVKLQRVCKELFKDLDKNAVDFIDNYDGTMKEPALLPTTYPNVLVNCNQGIAVGMASSMCSFNLAEVCKTTIQYIRNRDVNITKYLKAPDFTSGGQLIYNEKQIEQIYTTGRGSLKLRAKYEYDKTNNCIDIRQIPYTTTTEAILESIANLIKKGRIREISDIRDETDLNGLKITLDLKRNVDPDVLMKKIFKLTPLQDSFSCNFNILVNGRPKVMGIKSIMEEWIIFRIGCIKRKLVFDIDKKTDKLHLLTGLKKILLDMDKAIRIIRNTEEDSKVIPNLMRGFDIDKVQAEFIAEIKLRNLNREYILNRISEVDELKKEIQDLKDLHDKEYRIKNLIISELKKISKKYGQPRRTEIIHERHIDEITEEHLIEDYNLKIFLTEHNYLKKIPLVSLRTNPEHKLKDDDSIMQEVEATNKSDLLLFSNKHTVYKLRIHEIDDCKTSNLGDYLVNMLGLSEDENIIYIVATEDYSGYMLFFYENGKAARIALSSYTTKTNRKKLAKAYSTKNKLVNLIYIDNDREMLAVSSIKKVLVFNTSKIKAKSTRDSQGVKVLTSKKGSVLTDVIPAEESGINNLDYYRTKNIPAIGRYLKSEDRIGKQQMSLF